MLLPTFINYSWINPAVFGASNNNDYPEILIDSIPVPDFISNPKNEPIAQKMLIDRIVRLTNFGVDIIGMACNTAHLLYPYLSSFSNVPFVSMIDLVSQEVQKRGFKKVGLFATPTTIRSDLYKNSLFNYQIEVVYPSKIIQKNLEKIVRQVVAGKTSTSQSAYLLTTAQSFIRANRLDGLILGCTELPLVFPKDEFEVIDCLDVLANYLLLSLSSKGDGRRSEGF